MPDIITKLPFKKKVKKGKYRRYLEHLKKTNVLN